MPHSPPILLAAHYVNKDKLLTLVYDRLLKTGTVAPGNLEVRFNVLRLANAVPGTIVGNTVTSVLANPFGDVGADVADYHATPPDILSQRGGVAPAFLDFPLT